MSIENVARNRLIMLEQAGKTALNIKYPDEFELYLCALELTDQYDNTLRYFVFPVMPSSMNESIPQITNIKKTLAGVTVLSNPTFVPTDISISGTFGRKFRVLLGTDYQDFISSFRADNGKVTLDSAKNGVVDFFDDRIKTGYGCIKILQEIIDQSKQVDENGIKRLIWHNPALGNSYLVKAMPLSFSMSEDSNMIWNYSLQMKSVAPLSALYSSAELQKQRERLNITGLIQQKVNSMVNDVTALIADGDYKLSNAVKKWVTGK